jgi:hypothetical protein
MKKFINLLIVLIGISQASAAPLPDYTFKSPAFNGNGYSSHVLTLENQERTRKENIKKEIQAALDKAKNDANNTNVAKFLNNNGTGVKKPSHIVTLNAFCFLYIDQF